MTLVHLSSVTPERIHGEHHLSNPEEAEQYLSELGRRIFPDGPRVAQHVHAAEITDVPRAIAEHATELSSDLIIMCAHGQIGLRALLFGTIAQQVAASSAVPVLLIRPGEAGAAPILSERPILVVLDGTSGRVARSREGVRWKFVWSVVSTLETLSGVAPLRAIAAGNDHNTSTGSPDAPNISRQIALLQRGLRVSVRPLRGEPSDGL